MPNGGKDNGRFRTATLVNWHLLPEVELTPGGFAKMQAAPWPEGIDTMVRFKDALSCDFREAQGLLVYGKLTPDIEQVCKDAGIQYKNFPHTMMGARFLTKQYAGKLAQADKNRRNCAQD